MLLLVDIFSPLLIIPRISHRHGRIKASSKKKKNYFLDTSLDLCGRAHPLEDLFILNKKKIEGKIQPMIEGENILYNPIDTFFKIV